MSTAERIATAFIIAFFGVFLSMAGYSIFRAYYGYHAGTIVLESPIGTIHANNARYKRDEAGVAVKGDDGWVWCHNCEVVVLPKVMKMGPAPGAGGPPKPAVEGSTPSGPASEADQ